jgi:hypothetical protein
MEDSIIEDLINALEKNKIDCLSDKKENIINLKKNNVKLTDKNNVKLTDKNNVKLTDKNNFDIMELIDEEDKELLNNKRILHMSKIDWGKTISISNQYIQRNVLRKFLKNLNIYCTDDKDLPKNINISNNSPGFDIVINSNNKNIRIQSKLRQVEGNFDYSQQIEFETTRRNSIKNNDKNHTGHICYGIDEFDFVMVTLVNVKHNRDYIKDCNKWSFSLIPLADLIDKEKKNCCIHKITPTILQKNLIDFTKDIIL